MVSQVERKDNQGPRQNKRRSLKPWMFQYIKPVEIPEELLKSIVASGLQKPQSRSRLVTVEGQTKTITKREENFNERIRNLTFMPTEKQTEEFHRHGFTTVAVLFTLFYPVFINIEPLITAREQVGTPQLPRFAWFNKLMNAGAIIAIASGKQPVPSTSRRILTMDNPEDFRGFGIRFHATGNEHKEPPYNPELFLLYQEDYYTTGSFREGTGIKPPSLLITSHKE